jgi:H/ACA ribonucleoprotein complex subunit 4
MVEGRDMKQQKPINELLEFCIVNIDKPSGLTSHDVVQKVKRILNAKRVGHTGTLDPMVTGVLPVLINRACKLSDYFMKKDKVYIGKMKIHKSISKEKLENEMKEFVGKIMQKPPVRSRVKRVERERNVNKFRLIDFDKETGIASFESDVQAGTYIRKLISDLGEKIGGAHMIELRRIRAGLFEVKNSVKLDDLYNSYQAFKDGNEEKLREILIPAEIIKQLITGVQVKENSVSGLLNGKPLMKEDLKSKRIPNSDLVSVFSGERFIGVYRIVNSLSKDNEASEIVARAEFVRN